MDNQFLILKNKLESFIRRYYINLIIRGSIIVPALLLAVIILVSVLEFFGWFNINIRLFIFLSSLSSFIFIFSYFLFVPILKYFGFGKRLTDKKAAVIISNYFPELKDYIINILELNKLEENELIVSSINQKIDSVKDYNFNKSINFLQNIKLGRFLIITFFVFVFTLLIEPKIYSEASKRIINYNKVYEKESGFTVHINNDLLSIKKGDDLNLNIEVSGEELPDELFINYGGSNYLLNKKSDLQFEYTFRNVNNNFSFSIINDFYESKLFSVVVNNPPILKNYSIEVIQPNYISSESIIYDNLNDITIPKGSKLKFEFNTLYTDKIIITNNDADSTFLLKSNILKFNGLASNNSEYIVSLFNEYTSFKSAITINVKVIPDLYPSIKVNYVNDKNNFRVFYFKGLIEDDYGFYKLNFLKSGNPSIVEIPIQKNVKSQEFYFAYEFPLNEVNQEIYFEIFDNDKLAGYKKTKSEIISFVIPSLEKVAEQNNENYEELNSKLDRSLLLASELNRDIEEIKKSLINDNLEVWEKKSKLEALEQKHKQLEKLINDISADNLNKDSFNNSFSEEAKDLAEKQKQIQELLDDVLTDELKELMNQINELSKDFDQNKLQDLTDDLELNYEQLSDQLDRNMELLKRFEVEEKLKMTYDRLKELEKKQNEITENISKKNQDLNKTKNKIKDNNDKLDKIKEDYSELLKKNDELSKSMDLDDLKSEFENLNNNLDKLSNELGNNKKEDSNRSNEIEKDVKDLAEKVQEMLDENINEQAGEDAELLRQILENLFVFSFRQENIYKDLKFVSHDNPQFAKLKIEQTKLIDDYSIIRDSLFELGSRSSHIGTHIINSAFNIETKLLDINDNLKDNRIGVIQNYQRELLTNTNDMILLLSESLKKMDNSMGSGGKSGNKKKKKPQKGDQPSLSEMQQGQEGLKQQLQQMLNQMKNNGGNMSQDGLKQMGKSLAQQEILQQMLNEMLNNGSVGKDATKKLEEIKRLMEANKRDLVNMNIDNRLLNRQKQIITRLLEAETAEMERDKDDKRESKQAFNYDPSNPDILFEENSENINFNEIFNTKSINLFDFYKYKYQEYLIKVNNYTNEKRN